MKSETFGEKIKKLRKSLGLSLRVVAAAVDFDQSSLSKVERNEIIAPQRIISPLAKILKVDYEKLQIKYLSEKIFYELKNVDFAKESLKAAEKRLENEGSGTAFNLRKDSLISKIKEYLKEQPIEKAWLFGSFARSEESLDSDLDLLIRFRKPNNIDLFDYIGMTQDLEDLTGRQVDMVEEGQLISNAKEIVEREKVLIYER